MEKNTQHNEYNVFIDTYCTVDQTFSNDDFRIEINTIDAHNQKHSIASIHGFFYSDTKDEFDSFYIIDLRTEIGFERKGLGTLLMCKALEFAESQHVDYVTVYPSPGGGISESDLIQFYKKFYFTNSLGQESKIIILPDRID